MNSFQDQPTRWSRSAHEQYREDSLSIATTHFYHHVDPDRGGCDKKTSQCGETNLRMQRIAREVGAPFRTTVYVRLLLAHRVLHYRGLMRYGIWACL